MDNEVDEIDSLSIDPFTILRTNASISDASPVLKGHDSAEGMELSEKPLLDEKAGTKWRERLILPPVPEQSWTKRIRNHLPRLPTALVYVRLFFLPTSTAVKGKHGAQLEQVFDRSTLLKRITDTRRLVTGLSRLLGAKHHVIGGLRKRGTELGGGVDAYIGDVEGEVFPPRHAVKTDEMNQITFSCFRRAYIITNISFLTVCQHTYPISAYPFHSRGVGPTKPSSPCPL